ncbi:MAG TPA: aminotransferase class I/II-fold pyridoxal phosphate-dependent enzyme [Nitrososphaerales archaeon]|nr:aminotransferase class I/II-fold pyridoxal phosphate-dependent enzyme [Nitrososphaerales archaeon]
MTRSDMEQSGSELQGLREEVAETTKEIIKQVARRIELAKRIGQVKSRDSLPIDNERVEDALLEEVLQECKELGLDEQLGTKILATLLAESKRAQRAQGSAKAQPLITPMVMMAKATEIEKKGKKLIRLDVGEPAFHPPRAVLDAVSEALYSYKTYYTVGRGIPELLSALRNYLAKRYAYREAAENQLIVTPGGRFAVYSALATVASEGDSVVVIEPNWPAYKEGLDYIGARPIVVQTTLEERWQPSPEKVKAAVRPNTKAIVLSYPANPTGMILGKAKFKEIVGIADDLGLAVISDEIYNDYAYEPCPTILEDLPRKYILTSSFSKGWSMTGFRVGYSLAPAETSSRMLKVLGLMITCVPEFIQRGAAKALECEEEVSRNSRAMKERIDATSAELRKIDALELLKPEGAIYAFPQAKDPRFDSATFAIELLEKKGVTVSPGTGFGDYPRCFRISLGQPQEVLTAGVRKIGELLG